MFKTARRKAPQRPEPEHLVEKSGAQTSAARDWFHSLMIEKGHGSGDSTVCEKIKKVKDGTRTRKK